MDFIQNQIYASTHAEISSFCSVESREMLKIVRWLLIFIWTLYIHAPKLCSAVNSRAPASMSPDPQHPLHICTHICSAAVSPLLLFWKSSSCGAASSSDCRMRDVLEIKSTSCTAVFINESMKTGASEGADKCWEIFGLLFLCCFRSSFITLWDASSSSSPLSSPRRRAVEFQRWWPDRYVSAQLRDSRCVTSSVLQTESSLSSHRTSHYVLSSGQKSGPAWTSLSWVRSVGKLEQLYFERCL